MRKRLKNSGTSRKCNPKNFQRGKKLKLRAELQTPLENQLRIASLEAKNPVPLANPYKSKQAGLAAPWRKFSSMAVQPLTPQDNDVATRPRL